MRKKEIYALLVTAGLMVLILLGYVFIDGGWRTATDYETERHTLTEEGGEDVQDPPPSAVGDITEP